METLERYQEALRDAEAELAKWQKVLDALEAVKPIDRSLYHGLYRSEIIERVECAARDVAFIKERMPRDHRGQPRAAKAKSPYLEQLDHNIAMKFVWKRLGFIMLRRKKLSRLGKMSLYVHNTTVRRYNRKLEAIKRST